MSGRRSAWNDYHSESVWDEQRAGTQNGDKHGEDDCKDEDDQPRSSWQIIKDCGNDYLDVSSMHGLAFFVGSRYHPLRRLLWFALFTASFTWLMIIVTTAFDNLQRKPVLTKVKVKYEDNARFPTVTICNLNKYRKSYVEKHHPHSEKLLRYIYPVLREDEHIHLDWSDPKYAWSLNRSSFKEFALKAAPQMMDNIKIVDFGAHWLTISNEFSTIETDFGMCFQFNPNGTWYSQLSGEMHGLAIVLDVQQDDYYFGDSFSTGFKIALHRHDEVPFPNQFSFGVSPGQELLVGMTMTEVKSLPAPYEDGTCVDTEAGDFINPLKYFKTYKYNSCRKECQTVFSVGQCGCKPAFDPGPTRTCIGEEYRCYRLATEEYAKNHSIERECNCRLPCHERGYVYQLSSLKFPAIQYEAYFKNTHNISLQYARENLMLVRIYFEKMNYELVEQVLGYDGMNFFADFGGNSGLCIGASLLTVAELLELIAVIVFNLIFRRRKKTSPEKQ